MTNLIEEIRTSGAKKITSSYSMMSNYWENMTERFDDEVGFFKLWLKDPKTLGAVLPTSKATADRMASVTRTGDDKHVLELGPGSGIITRSLLGHGVKPENLHLVEYTNDFVQSLRRDYPDINVMQGDAFDLDKVLEGQFEGRFDTIVSGIPLLNFPLNDRLKLMTKMLDVLEPGRPIVQFSYGLKSPFPPDSGLYSVEPLDWMLRNIPPARIWLYRRKIG